jgi:hypothetical protein
VIPDVIKNLNLLYHSRVMADTLLILHVKGTVAETAELPKNIVREAISQGQLTQSQLIWSPVDNAWKQVRELPDLLPNERLILHVKGTETDTTELPKQAIRSAISHGQITHSQLIWSPADGAWRQVRELPELLPTQKLAPAPPRAVPVPKAVEEIIPESPTGSVARAAAPARPRRVRVARARVAGPPRVRVAGAPAGPPRVRAAETHAIRTVAPVVEGATGDLVVKAYPYSQPLKWVCIGLGIFILLVLGGNYLLVNRPLVSNLGQTPYSNVAVYAHLGAFMQPNVMVIHIPASTAITPDNLTDFLVALAQSTPQTPITRGLFDRVALTSGWTAQYSFSGGGWKALGDMRQDSKAHRKEFLLAQMADADGQPVPKSTAERDKVWDVFAAHFIAKR